jgi:hypothetical protein
VRRKKYMESKKINKWEEYKRWHKIVIYGILGDVVQGLDKDRDIFR